MCTCICMNMCVCTRRGDQKLTPSVSHHCFPAHLLRQGPSHWFTVHWWARPAGQWSQGIHLSFNTPVLGPQTCWTWRSFYMGVLQTHLQAIHWQRSRGREVYFNFQAPDGCFTQLRPTMQSATKLMQCSHYWTACGHAVSMQSSLFSCCFCLFSRAHSIGSFQVFRVYSILYWTFSSLHLSYNRSSPMSASTQSQSKERFFI